MSTADEISLRPLGLRPGGGGGGVNPFASFAMGAGIGLKNKATSARGEEKKKPRGEVTKYPREFMMKFAQMYTQMPTELQFNNLEIVLDPSDPEREAQRALLQRVVADDADERDWRQRTPLPPTPAVEPREAAPVDPAAPKIQRAADLGRTAWAPIAPEPVTATTETAAQSLRKVKGILNKLTPEKFERLLSQLIPLISSYEVLQDTIVQVFENAVAQPTFVAMYADLCAELDAALPEFEGPDGPQSFKKMLANTCQEEYESTEAARIHAQSIAGEARDAADRKAKQRLLGNVRLIAELFKKGMVNDRIILLILSDLLGPQDQQEPSEDSIEAACEVVATAGAALEEAPPSKARLDAVFAQLAKLAAAKGYAPRIRFVIRDVIDLRSQHWVARRETFTAKKLDEIRNEAQAELGILDISIPGLEPLVAGLEPLPGMAVKRADDMELFPAFKGADLPAAGGAGSGSAAGAGATNDGEKFSAFLGEYVPLPESVATPPEAPGQAPRAARTDLSVEDRESLTKSLFTDFISSGDFNEALATAQELITPGFGSTFVRIGIEKAFDTLSATEQVSIATMIVDLTEKKAITAADLESGVNLFTADLGSLSMDVPKAPLVLGLVMGGAASRALLGVEVIAAQAGGVEDAEPRRAFVVAAFNAVKETQGEDGLVAAVKAAGVDIVQLLEKDAEFESHLSSGSEFVEEQGLSGLVL